MNLIPIAWESNHASVQYPICVWGTAPLRIFDAAMIGASHDHGRFDDIKTTIPTVGRLY